MSSFWPISASFSADFTVLAVKFLLFPVTSENRIFYFALSRIKLQRLIELSSFYYILKTTDFFSSTKLQSYHYVDKKRLEPSKKKSVTVLYKHFEEIFRLLKNKHFQFCRKQKNILATREN